MSFKLPAKARPFHSWPDAYKEIVELTAAKGEHTVMVETLGQQISLRTNLYRFFKSIRAEAERTKGQTRESWAGIWVGAIDGWSIFGVEEGYGVRIGKKDGGKLAQLLRKSLEEGKKEGVKVVEEKPIEGQTVSVAEMKRIMRERGQ